MIITNSKLYDTLKFLAQIGLPALATLYFALAGIWGLPAAEAVVATIVALDTFLGVMLQISSATYDKSETKYDGAMVVTESPTGMRTFTLELNDDPEYHLEGKDEILFKVKKIGRPLPRPVTPDPGSPQH